MFGENLTSQIALNLLREKINSKISIYITQINPLTKYVIVITLVANAIKDTFSFLNKRLVSISIKTLLVISTVIVIVTILFFGAFLRVVVSMLLTILLELWLTIGMVAILLEWWLYY